MSIVADFVVDYDNKIIRHVTGTEVYSVNVLYSWMQDLFDEVISLTRDEPMSAQTPTEYTLINSWFIPDDTFKYLNRGAIKTQGLDAATYSEGVYVIKLSASGYTNFAPDDIGKEIVAGATTGTLLDYNNSLRKLYVRRKVGTSWSGGLIVTSGTGAGTITSVVTGENLYSNIYTLGVLEPATTNTLYIQQVNSELTNDEIANYWGTGHIDLVVKVKEAGQLIDNGFLTIFCREYTDLYSHFKIDVSTGGRNPVPLATSDDSNNQTPSANVAAWSDVTITFGSFIRDLQDGTGPQSYAVEINCGSRASLNEVYQRLKLVTARNSGFTLNGYSGQFYKAANNGFNEVLVAPFGTYAGGKFFGARGVWLTNVPVYDLNNYQVTDSSGVSHNSPYTATGAFVLNSALINDPAAKVAMYYTAVPAGMYGFANAVIVTDAFNTELITTVNGRSTIPWSYAYDTNTDGGRISNTDAAVTVVAIGLSSGKQVTATHTITRAEGQNISLAAADEKIYRT